MKVYFGDVSGKISTRLVASVDALGPYSYFVNNTIKQPDGRLQLGSYLLYFNVNNPLKVDYVVIIAYEDVQVNIMHPSAPILLNDIISALFDPKLHTKIVLHLTNQLNPLKDYTSILDELTNTHQFLALSEHCELIELV